MAPEHAEPVRYRFGPLERRGVIAGWRGGQVLAVAAGLVVAVGLLQVLDPFAGGVLGLLAVAAGVAVATWPVGGRTGDEWAPDLWRYATATALGRRGWRVTPAAMASTTGDGAGGSARHRAAPRRGPGRSVGGLPHGPFDALQLVACDFPQAPPGGVGVVLDHAPRRYTAVFPATPAGFVLLGSDDRDRRVNAWASVLTSLVGDGRQPCRLQWIVRTLPDGAAWMARTSGSKVGPGVSRRNGKGPGLDPLASYERLLAAFGADNRRHEVLLAVSVGAQRTGRHGRSPDEEGCLQAMLRAARVRQRLADVQITTGPLLDAPRLAATLRVAWAQGERLVAAGRDRADERVADAGAHHRAGAERRRSDRSVIRWPWPVATEAHWDVARVDGTWHATSWVSEWPRIDVRSDFLAPLLLSSGVRQTVSVVMEPEPPLRAARRAEQTRTADVADAELRRRGGFLPTMRRQRQEETLLRREAELADGHAEYRFSAFVTATADERDALDESCARIEQAASQAGLELRRCYGDQVRAFTFSLPLGRGLS